MTLGEALRWGAEALRRSGSPTPMLDARVLLMEASRRDAASLIAGDRERLDDGPAGLFAELIEARTRGAPIAYLVERQEFFGHDFAVGQGVLIPRPETEMLVEAALAALPKGGRVLDAGTGSGAILLSVLAARPAAEGVGFDASGSALAYALDNAERLALGGRAELTLAEFRTFDAGGFDVVVSNPPYIEAEADLPVSVAAYEPASALFAGEDGLDAYRAIASRLASWLGPGGSAFFECGTCQGERAAAVLVAPLAATHEVRVHPDLAGHDRMIALTPR